MASLAEQLALRKASLVKTERQAALALQPERYEPSPHESGEWRPCPVGSVLEDANLQPAEVRCLSFNIMTERVDLEARMAALLELIDRMDADVVCLQESTAQHNELLCSSPVVRSRYYRSSFSGQGHGFKVSLFSKLHLTRLMLYDLSGRPCVTGYFKLRGAGGGEPALVAVSSVHLTSGSNSGIRREQLRSIYEQTAACETSLVMGDFNACQPAEDDASVERAGFVDVWPRLHPPSAGAEPSRASDGGITGFGCRLDRAALRSQSWAAHSMEVVGRDCEPVVSDHLGIFLVLRPREGRLEGMETTDKPG